MPTPGQMIRITAAGSSAVPAFETTVTVPSHVTLKSPSGMHSFSLASGLPFAWAWNSELVRVAARISGYGFDGSDPSYLYSSYAQEVSFPFVVSVRGAARWLVVAAIFPALRVI